MLIFDDLFKYVWTRLPQTGRTFIWIIKNRGQQIFILLQKLLKTFYIQDVNSKTMVFMPSTIVFNERTLSDTSHDSCHMLVVGRNIKGERSIGKIKNGLVRLLTL